jgi:hypothetical protein
MERYGLSRDLWAALDFELSKGNKIARVDQPAGTRCQLAVVFSARLHIGEFVAEKGLPPSVEVWENRDTHYAVERGYVSTTSRHAISGPL